MNATPHLGGRVALVTGSARRTGRVIARKLAAAGASVCVNARRSKNEAEAVAREIEAAHGAGRAIEGTFVEDALDTVEAGLNVTAGTAVALARSLQLTAELRGSVTSELRTLAARGGFMVRLPRRGAP